jgi:dihydrodiol dehydrogenase / D-xylose 1-dehydrogenase (NADP)
MRALTTTSTSRVIRWGILSAGKISSDYARAIAATEGAQAYAVAARQVDAARRFAAAHDAAMVAHDSYHALVTDPAVDVVYVGAVAEQHAALTRLALEAGKAVVVEKPLTLSCEETAALVDLARQQQCFLMEGMWTRCFPATHWVRDTLASGILGTPVAVQGDFGWATADCDAAHRIWSPASGGMVLDIAMYLGQWGSLVYDMDDYRMDGVQAMGTLRHGVDHSVMAQCRYRPVATPPEGSEKRADGFLQFYLTGAANTEERLVVQGTRGRIVVESPSHVPTRVRLEVDAGRGQPLELQTHHWDLPDDDDSTTSWNYPGSSGFTYQIAAVGQALREGRLECPDYTWRESLQVAALLDELRAQVHPNAEARAKTDPTTTTSVVTDDDHDEPTVALQ